MPKIECQICGGLFYAKPSHVVRGWGKYCSKQCQFTSQKSGIRTSCFTCGAEVYKSLTDQRKSRSKHFFCNKSCQTKWRNSQVYIGKNHGNWITGEASYRPRLLRSNVAQECSKCKTSDVRVLAVHHKDKNRSNNELSNLLWLCHNCHYLVHHFEKESVGFIVALQ
jgi:hypothetical protein